MVDNRRKVGWAVEGDLLDGVEVSLKNALNSEAVGVVGTQVQEELVRQLTRRGNSGTEPES